jgi:tetratricopeptide (TPR) repeat protein
MSIDTKFVKSASLVFIGLMSVASGVHAQEAKQNMAQREEPGDQKQIENETREKPLRDAEALMKDGKPAEAFALLEALEFDRAGEVRFDYLIGIAALDSGKPARATLAFERVLAVDPNFSGARVGMARAYYQLGDLSAAKTEFDTLMKQNPPAAIRVIIQDYLDAIVAHEEAKQTRFTAYVESGAGHDSNVNSSTNQAQFSVPYFNDAVIMLSPSGQKTADNYYTVAAGGEITRYLSANWGLYAGADARLYEYHLQKSYNTLNLDGHGGVMFSGNANIFHVGGMAGQYELSDARYRSYSGLSADWRHILSLENQLSVAMQAGRNRFVDAALALNDFNQVTLGSGWLHVMPDWKSALLSSLFLTRENEVAPVTLANPSGGRADGNRRTLGLRVGIQVALNEVTELFGNLGWQSGKYDKINAAFLRKRNDRQYDVTVGTNWHLDKSWTLRPQLSYTKNDSNIVIYGYDRMDVSLTIRRDFW